MGQGLGFRDLGSVTWPVYTVSDVWRMLYDVEDYLDGNLG